LILINDKNCSDLKIVFSELPSIPKPVRNVEEKLVSGRDGSLIIDRGTYQNIPIMLIGHAECKRTELIDYFGTTGELKFETSPDRFWKYRVTAIDIKEVLDDGVLLAFSINMSLDSHKYLVSGKSKIIGSSTLSLKNDYNANAYPFLKIKGTGTIGIIKNGIQILSIKDITDYVDIDCEADIIHRNNVNYDNKATGDTFYLDANKTTELKFTGNVSEVILIPNWREI
jgi:hypothetical protein